MGLWLGWMAFCLVLALGPRLQVGVQPRPDPTQPPEFKLADQMPYKWVWKAVPFIRSSRSVNRWIALGQMFIGILMAVGAKRLLDRFRAQRNVVFGCVLGLLLFEQLGVPLPMMDKKIPAVYPTIAAHGAKGCVSHMDPPWCCANQLFQTVHGQPLVDLIGFSMPAACRRAESLPIEQTARLFWLYLLPRQAMEKQSADVDRIAVWPDGMTFEQRVAAAREVQRQFSLVYIIVPKSGFEYKGRLQIGYADARTFLEALGPTRTFEDKDQTLFIYDQYAR